MVFYLHQFYRCKGFRVDFMTIEGLIFLYEKQREKYKRIVDEGSDFNCPSIEPQGVNEPLLVRDFHKYVRYAYDKGFMDIMINTNASALTAKRSQQLLDSGITRLRFSLDAATPETYKKVRVGSRPLDEVIKRLN